MIGLENRCEHTLTNKMTESDVILTYSKENEGKRWKYDFVHGGEKHTLIITHPCDGFMRVAGADSDGFPTKLDDAFEMVGVSGGRAQKVGGAFAVWYNDTYTIKYRGVPVLRLEQMRQHRMVDMTRLHVN